jgi:hypothetical protein
VAIMLVMEFEGVPREKYDAVIKELGLDKPNAQWPKGLISHVAGPYSEGWCVVDAWESQTAFDTFFTKQLQPAINRVGNIPKPGVETIKVHNSHGLPIPAMR